eukprot:TRINITY_DN4653_c0_g1_i1.p1 TRINITY_DN4653_c0_g1~~TRINITY_DN4653_c0_g1_i1.p1  ORF type:complete len:621 (+),score=131.39 TRINITY_DN4653_c0_g1_i1:155-2017(+)
MESPSRPKTSVSRKTEESESEDANKENIRVVCRFRPENDEELKKGKFCIDFDPDTKSARLNLEKSYDFNFSKVYQPFSTQEEVYEYSAQPLVEAVLKGYNAAVISYGQTGAGKTFTMQGPGFDDPRTFEGGLNENTKGIIPRILQDLFSSVAVASSSYEFELSASYLEIYNETLVDLLRKKPTSKLDKISGSKSEKIPKLEIRQTADKGLWITDVTEKPILQIGDVLPLMKQGAENRRVAATGSNEESSRSHAIFLVTVCKRDLKEHFTTTAQLYLVDLAGSEKVSKTNAEGIQLNEAKYINQSLFTLGNVIYALSTNAGYIPYRDSVLTRMLQNSLGGNSKTTLIINCSPNSFNGPETLSTLRFGDKSKSIQNRAKVNQERTASELLFLLEQSRKENRQQSQYIGLLESEISKIKNHLGEEYVIPDFVKTARTPRTMVISAPVKHNMVEMDITMFLCPISQQPMSDPVLAIDGYTYDRQSIEKWFKKSGQPLKSPITHSRMESKILVPNQIMARQLAIISDELKKSFSNVFGRLPRDMVNLVFSLLDHYSLVMCSGVCRSWLTAARNDNLWRQLLQRTHSCGVLPGLNAFETFQKIFATKKVRSSTIRISSGVKLVVSS